MQPYTSDTSERYSIWEAHKHRCFWCREIVAFVNLHIDHLIPLSATDCLSPLIQKYSFPEDLEINDFRNVAPACAKCNRDKGDTIFEPSPALLVQFANVANLEQRAIKILRGIKRGDFKAKLIVLFHEETKKGNLAQELWKELNTSSYDGQTLEERLSDDLAIEQNLDEDQAIDLVSNLLEVRDFAQLLNDSDGAGNLGFMARIAGDSWCIQVFESKETHITTFGWYEVAPEGTVRKIMIV